VLRKDEPSFDTSADTSAVFGNNVKDSWTEHRPFLSNSFLQKERRE
jgi:hypothetical protein